MSGRLIRAGHVCRPVDSGETLYGAVWRCDCRTYWFLEANGKWQQHPRMALWFATRGWRR